MNLSSWLFGVLFAEPQRARLNQQTKHVEILGDCLSDAGSIPAVSTNLHRFIFRNFCIMSPKSYIELN